MMKTILKPVKAETKETPMFLTGSHAYGTPKDESDVDLVVYIEDGLWEFLAKHREIDKGNSFYFGKINFILCDSIMVYKAWKFCTEELVKQKPVTRDFAVQYIQEHFESIDIPLNYSLGHNE